ncbi:MAG: 30S ribosomal protein S17, partial [Candidatus Methanomethylicaceae archaeon]
IIGRGAHPAFPCNICLNSVAAHYTPRPEDDLKIREGDVVKIAECRPLSKTVGFVVVEKTGGE